jgi:hypothetical protein
MEEILDWELSLDLTYYAVDLEGNILYIESGGMKFPRSVSKARVDWKKVCDFFEHLNPNGSNFELGPHPFVQDRELPLGAHVGDPTVWNLQSYTGFDYVRKGLFVFDYDWGRYHEDPKYILALRPTKPLHISSLPQDIAGILGRTVLGGSAKYRDWIVCSEFT